MCLNLNDIQSAVEAILFAAGEPVEAERICEVLEIDIDRLAAEIIDLQAKLQKMNSGIEIVRLGNQYQICTREKYSEPILAVMDKKRNTPLSQAAFEVLAIVAYNQPVTKAFIEQIRGVDCTSVISTLCAKELIEEAGRLELPGRPLIYKTTSNFLRCFGLSDLTELPEIPENVDNEIPPSELDQIEGQISMLDEEV
ncbi:MAG TPA: SMC-Scp complex subunit ScpB [Clostridiales bacterium]|nr:SMC-Scp complex subunit ScpB [Clostridiales bacterium]